jgi:membrane glycosyltransferase
MLIQSGHVFAVFMGRDSGWNPQRRDDGGTTWSDAWHFHKRHMFLSCVTAVIVWFLSPPLLAWLTPEERVEVAGDARLLNQLAFLPDAEYPLFLI